MLSWEVLFLLEEDYCPKPSSEIRDGYRDFYEWTKACIFEEKYLYNRFMDNPFFSVLYQQ